MRLAATGLGCAMILCSALVARAQAPIPSNRLPSGLKAGKIKEGLSVVERGPNHRVFENWSTNGVRTRYVELASGLHVKDGKGGWKEADLKIALDVNGAIAEGGTVKVRFTADINSRGGIALDTPSGDRFRSHVTGLAYFDRSSGQSVLLAETKSSIGKIIENTVVYEDAFDDIQADVRYTHAKGFFEQDVILREQPPAPEKLGLNPDTTELIVMTEFVESPRPKSALRLPASASLTATNTATNATAKASGQRAAVETAKAVPDDVLEFKDTFIGSGKAFSEGENSSSVRVQKEFKQLDGRQFLIESVPLKAAAAEMQVLKKSRHASVSKINKALYAGLRAPAAKPESGSVRAMQYAGISPRSAGYVVDYQQLTSSATDFTFEAGNTYLVTGLFTASGTTVIEPAAVIKNTGASGASIRILGGLECRTTAERPVIFTSSNDNTIGDTISGSTGTPSQYNGPAIELDYASGCTPATLSNFRISKAFIGVRLNGSNITPGSSYLKHGQFVNCYVAVYLPSSSYPLRVQNALVSGGTFVFASSGQTIGCEHITVDGTSYLQAAANTLGLTNSLLVAVANAGTYTGVGNQTATSASGVFETVGAGAHYLPAGSSYRNAGVAGIDWKLRNDLGERTTFSPQILQGPISVDTTLRRRLIRDNDTPDLGYHYAAVDYAANMVVVTNGSTLVLGEGVTVAAYGLNSAFWLNDGNLSLAGSPNRPTHLLLYSGIQEQSAWWGPVNNAGGVMPFNVWHNSGSGPKISYRFAEVGPVGSYYQFYTMSGGWDFIYFDVKDSVFHGGQIAVNAGGSGSLTVANSLIRCPMVSLWATQPVSLRNNLFLKSMIDPWAMGGGSILAKDNVFYATMIWDSGGAVHGNNAYVAMPTSTDRFDPAQSTDKVMSSIDFVPGLMGRYYLPPSSVLRNAGSQTAAAAGLYHYTTSIDQVKEGTTTVDIGLHYPALVADSPWVDDSTPSGASLAADHESWSWTSSTKDPVSGSLHHTSQTPSTEAWSQHYFYGWPSPQLIQSTNVFYAYAWVDPAASPQSIQLQFHATDSTGWDHRPLFGNPPSGYPTYILDKTGDPLPQLGKWTRLEVTAGDVKVDNQYIDGLAFTLFGAGGHVIWDRAGLLSYSSYRVFPDTDGDGIPDYVEDKNGNGSFDSGLSYGESDWQTFNSPLGNGNGSALMVFTPLR